MFLKQIKMQGFKSFVDLTHLFFQSNRSAIVGPNGCGKSNVIDAVRWVMGETSAKFLRGDLMADVIFNGSLTRKASGQASVEIILDNHQAYLQGAFVGRSEVSLRREMNRSGDSAYYINGKRVRRKDLNDLWLGTGAGARGYAIIGQNMVHHLVEANPDVLRSYLEEAAGVSKYKERRKESAERLLQVEENMARIRDMLAELEQGLQRLALEAKDAKIYHQTRQQIREYQEFALLAQARSLQQKQETLHQKEQISKKDLAEIAVKLELEQTKMQTLETELQELQAEILVLEQNLFKQTLALEQAEKSHLERLQRQQTLQDEFAQVRQASQVLADQCQADEQVLREKMSMIEQLNHTLARLLAAEQQILAELQGLQIEFKQLQQTLHSERQQQQQKQMQLQIILTKKQYAQDNLRQVAEQMQKWKRELGQQHDLGLQASIATAAAELEVKTKALTDFSAALMQLKQAEQEAKQYFEQVAKVTQDLTDKQQMLAQRLAREQASYQGLLAGQGGRADNQFLDNWLKTWQIPVHWRFMLDYIWQRFLPGSLGLVAHPSELPFGYLAKLQRYLEPEDPGLPLSSLLGFMGVSDYPSGFMPWSNIWVAETRDQAWALRHQLDQNASIMTPDGLWLGLDWSVVVSFAEGGLASQLQVVAQLEQALHQAEQERDASRQILEQATQNLEQLEQKVLEVKSEYDECNFNLRRLYQEQEYRSQQLQLRNDELARCRHELTQAEEKYASQMELLKQQQLEEEELHLALQSLSAVMQDMSRQRQDLESNIERLDQRLQTHKMHMNEEKLKLNGLQTEVNFLGANLPKLKAQQAQLELRRLVLSETIAKDQGVVGGQEFDFANLRLQLTQEKEYLQTKQILNQEKMSTRIVIQQNIEKLHQEQLKLLELKWRNDSALEQINDKIQALKLELNADFSPSLWQNLPFEQDEAFFKQKLAELTQKLQALGDVNLLAIGLFEQEQTRFKVLLAQEQDLSLAMQELQKAIATLDQDMQARLGQTLQAINQHLLSFFPQLFGGGEAKFVASCDNLLEANVAIEVQLPGKKQHRIQLLSGGEKALTAIALLFAIFALNPAPFCLLDEVDAALDDANVLRLAGLIKTMSESVQFILITHNPLTMHVAEELLGVTMQEPGVSRVVSVNVATALAMVNKE